MCTKSSFRLFAVFLLVLSSFVLGPSASRAASPVDALSYVTEEYPPFNMKGGDDVPTGLAVDVLSGMFELAGSELGAKDVKILPWARGYRELLNVPGTCLFSTTRTQERENLFKWVGPVFVSTFDAIAKRGKVSVSKPEDLVGLRVGVVRDDMGDKLAAEYGIAKIERVPSHEVNLKKLDEGRIDAMIFSKDGLKLLLKDTSLDPEDYVSVWTMSESRLYFAFHPDTDDAAVNALAEALEKLKSSGKYDEILRKYGFWTEP